MVAAAGLEPDEYAEERDLCRNDVAHFIDAHCWLDTEPLWEPFRLWPAQRATLTAFAAHKRIVCLKARQLGLSWLALAFALHGAVFTPGTTALFFSKGEKEAGELLRRLKGMVERLPSFLRPALAAPTNTEELTFANGSNVKIFPTTGGRSYTGSLAIVDEADWMVAEERSQADRLPALIDAVGPTVDAGGRLVLLSTPRKAMPNSLFKAIYRAAVAGTSSYHPVFLPWNARPDRTPAWYQEKRRDALAATGSVDRLFQEYPGSPEEALAPNSLDKRIAPAWLLACYREQAPLTAADFGHPDNRPPALPGLVVYARPAAGRRYVIGADPADGTPHSHESAAAVLDAESGEEVAALTGKWEPTTFAGYLDQLGTWFNRADVMVERNNHGHAVIGWFRSHSRLKLLTGHDGSAGWLTTLRSKALLYSTCADSFRDEDTILHSFETYLQLSSIEGATLKGPAGENDDRADAYALALCGAVKAARYTGGKATTKPLAVR